MFFTSTLRYRLFTKTGNACFRNGQNLYELVILLYGNKSFCSGYDLKMFAEEPRALGSLPGLRIHGQMHRMHHFSVAQSETGSV